MHLQRSLIEWADFLDVSVQGSVLANGAAIDWLCFERAAVGQSIHLKWESNRHRAGVFGSVNLSNAKIGGELQLQGSIFAGVLDLSGTDIGEDLVLWQSGYVPFWGPHSRLDLANAQTERLSALMPFSWVNIAESPQGEEQPHWRAFEDHVSRCVYHSASFKPGKDDPMSARALDLERCEMPEVFFSIGLLPYNTKIADETDLPLFNGYSLIPSSMRGFDYRTIDDRFGGPQESVITLPINLRPQMVDWVQASQWVVNWGGQDSASPDYGYEPVVYKQLIEYYERYGYVHDANVTKLQMHWDRMVTHENTPLGWLKAITDFVWMILSAWGVYPSVAVFWFMFLVFIGTMVANEHQRPPPQSQGDACGGGHSEEKREVHPRLPAMMSWLGRALGVARWPLWTLAFAWNWSWRLPILKWVGQRVSWPCFWYSLETAVPLINPSEDHRNWAHDEKQQAYFHFQKIAGFVLASVVVASLTLG